jgi:uncharacterized protein YkwD
LKVYAPYIPLLLVVSLGIAFSGGQQFRPNDTNVLSYAADISRQSLLKHTNQERADSGQDALRFDRELTKAAQLKADDMATRDYWSHDTPDGKKPWVFINKAGYDYAKVAENLAYGFGSSDSTISGWMNSPTHKANLLDSSLSDVGFGIANVPNYQDKGPQTVVVAMYGQPRNSTANTAEQTVLAGEEAKITHIQSLTGGQAPWSGFAIGILLGAGVMYLIVKHLRGIRRALLSSERFIIKHPVLDATVVATIVVATILSQTAGLIH